MTNTNNRTLSFLKELQKTIPDFNIKYKNQSLFMKIIGYLLFFNKGFMTTFITTIGSTVYFPTKDSFERDPASSQDVLAHEFVHALDAKNNPLFKLLYLFPQILSPLFIILFFLLPVYFNVLSLILAIICLCPIIPPFWRARDELRGYQMSLFIISELAKENNIPSDQYNLILNNEANFINEEFVSSNYYWMKRSGVLSQLIETINEIKNDDIVKTDSSYNIVRAALKSSNV